VGAPRHARSAVEARVLVTERLAPLRVGEHVVHQICIPYHWAHGSGLTTGDSANDLFGITLDPNVLIQESKVGACDIRARAAADGGGAAALRRGPPSPARHRDDTGPHPPPQGPAVIPSRTASSDRSPTWPPTRPRRATAARRLLHRHVDLHRLQGVRGRVQGVERRAVGRHGLLGMSYDNTGALGANAWRHVPSSSSGHPRSPAAVPATCAG
jgi:hypothetical protein